MRVLIAGYVLGALTAVAPVLGLGVAAGMIVAGTLSLLRVRKG